jgi:hypothetical protein
MIYFPESIIELFATCFAPESLIGCDELALVRTQVLPSILRFRKIESGIVFDFK